MRSAAITTTAAVLSTKIFARVLMLCELPAILRSSDDGARRAGALAIVASKV
jgi:hypothetical protein